MLKSLGNTILENRCKGQTVIFGQTPMKEGRGVMVSRIWVDEQKPIFVDNL